MGSILNPRDRKKAVQFLVENGGIFAAHFLTLYGLFADAKQEHSVQSLWRAKNKPAGTPLATLMPPTLLLELVDFDLVANFFHPILQQPDLANRYYRIPHFLQLPLKKGVNLPKVLITQGDGEQIPDTIINMWFPGYRPIDQLLELAYDSGAVIATTSLNYRHHDSVTDRNQAEDFCRQSLEEILMLTDSYAETKILPFWSGSYSILSTLIPRDLSGQLLIRDGNISSSTLSCMYKCEVTEAKQVIANKRPELNRQDIQAILQNDCSYHSITEIVRH